MGGRDGDLRDCARDTEKKKHGNVEAEGAYQAPEMPGIGGGGGGAEVEQRKRNRVRNWGIFVFFSFWITSSLF
jgi:hypothetical protein